MDETADTTDAIVEALRAQTTLNAGVLRALEAIALQADKYDAVIAELRADVDALLKDREGQA